MTPSSHWIVALVVLLPFVVASSTVLSREARDQSVVLRRGHALSALTLLLLGLGCSLCVVHAHSYTR